MLVTRFRPSAIRVLQNVSGFSVSGSTERSNRSFAHPVQRFESRRSLFNDEFLRLDIHCRKTQKIRLSTLDADGFKKRIGDLFQKSGLQSIFNDDLMKLINLAETDEDFELAKNILIGCMR